MTCLSLTLQAKLSHNSLCCECVFVCANTSHWKIGGFEAAAHHSKINHTVRLQIPLIVHSSTVSLSLQFIETIAAIRPPDTVPPEDTVGDNFS